MGLGHRQVLRVLSVCARSSRADTCVCEVSGFRAKHSGVSNPSLCLSFRGFKFIVDAKIIFMRVLGTS